MPCSRHNTASIFAEHGEEEPAVLTIGGGYGSLLC